MRPWRLIYINEDTFILCSNGRLRRLKIISHNNAITANFFCYSKLQWVSAWAFWPHFGYSSTDPARVALSRYPQALEESRVRPLNFHNISFFLSRPLCKKVSHSLHFIIFNMFGHEKIYRFIHYVWKASERLKVNRSRGVYQARQKGAQKLYIRIKCRFTHGCQYSW